MLAFSKQLLRNHRSSLRCHLCFKRPVTNVLYMTGDKAKEEFAPIQPFMDFEAILKKKQQLEHSINKRQMNVNLNCLIAEYNDYKTFKSRLQDLEKQREAVAEQQRQLQKKVDTPALMISELREKGKSLRQELKSLKEQFYPIENNFAQKFLDLPNILHTNCPVDGREKLLYRKGLPEEETEDGTTKSHAEHKDLIRFSDNDEYYLTGDAAMYDIYCPQTVSRYFVNNGEFTQTANPDFTRCVLLEASATPLSNYHRVIEETSLHGINYPYLTGGASFESFLGAFTKLCVHPNVLPLRLVSSGRCYERQIEAASGEPRRDKNLYTATQSNVVQTFCAVKSREEADEHLHLILNLAVDFYKSLDLHFRIRLADAIELTHAESMRASIEVYSPVEKRYVCVGRISDYSKFISKRILFGVRLDKKFDFLHLIGGPVVFTTRLIAALIENDIPLDYNSLAVALMPNNVKVTAFDEFRDIFT